MGDTAALKGPLAALAYGITSIAITLFNKAVLSVYNFKYPIVLTAMQSAVTLVSLVALKRMKIIHFPDFDMQTARKVFPLSFVFIFYVIVSLSALGAVNIPMFTALRRTTVAFVMLFEYVLLSKTPSRPVQLATAVMILGAIIAASKDLAFDMLSYTLVFLTNVSTATYVVMINRVKRDTDINVFGILFYNNVNTLPFLAMYAWVMGEWEGTLQFKYITDAGFQACFISSLLLAFLLNLTTFFSTTLNSALTQTVVGQVKNFIAFLLGLLLFSDYVYEPVNMFGLLVGFSGGVMYGVIKYREGQAKPPAAVAGSAAAATTGTGNVKAGAKSPVDGRPHNGGNRPEHVRV